MNDMARPPMHLWTPIQWAEVAAFALGQMPDETGAELATAFLQDLETHGPQYDAFGALRADAAWWAETAPAHEVQEYVYAGMKRLTNSALGESARKRFIAALWNGLQPDARKAFLAMVQKGEG